MALALTIFLLVLLNEIITWIGKSVLQEYVSFTFNSVKMPTAEKKNRRLLHTNACSTASSFGINVRYRKSC
jgi:hypothetical protein